jgi:hypothetical protein
MPAWRVTLIESRLNQIVFVCRVENRRKWLSACRLALHPSDTSNSLPPQNGWKLEEPQAVGLRLFCFLGRAVLGAARQSNISIR